MTHSFNDTYIRGKGDLIEATVAIIISSSNKK